MPFSSKNSIIKSNVIDCDLDIFLENFRNLSATETLIPSFSNRSFSNPLSIFSEKICCFYWAERVFSEKTMLKLQKLKQSIAVTY
jgi:hypothetical protein